MSKDVAAALDWYRRSEFERAEAACSEILARSADHRDALALLADIRLARGRALDAIPVLSRLVELDRSDPSMQRRLGGALLSAGRPGEAIPVLRQAIALEPGNARAFNNLGQALRQVGEAQPAIASYQSALERDPGYAIAHSNLGLAFIGIGDFARAEASLRRALAIRPSLPASHLNLGSLFERLRRLPDALASYDRAISLSPQLVDAWLGRGAVLVQQVRLEAALHAYESALRVDPRNAACLWGNATVLLAMDRAADALHCADRALAIDAASVDALNVRAGALRRLNRHAEALACLDQALALKPAFVEGWCNRGAIAYEVGDGEAAVASYQRALAADPLCVTARVRLLAARIPPLPMSTEKSAQSASEFDAELLRLEAWFDSTTATLADAHIAARQPLFYLSYREQSNAARLRRYRSATAARLAHVHATLEPSAAAQLPIKADWQGKKFKLAVVSAHVYEHSVWRAILQGWLKCLDRGAFDITVFSVGQRQDAVTRGARTSVDRFESDVRSVSDWVQAIQDCQPDALMYPEIGMDEITLTLANQRLAPRQLVAWGHPETSGLPTIDEYLSAEAFEPEGAQEHYSERLVLLPRLGTHVERLGTAPAPMDFDALGLGLPNGEPVFLCPGVPFKYRPEDDHVLVEIAQRLGHCTFLLFVHERQELSSKLHTRLAAAFRHADLDPNRHLTIIPWQSRAAFFGLLQRADVYLDTIGFSGFNTIMQGVETRLPCVTYEGRFMRGRLGSGIMRQLGLHELIAATKAQYVEIAVRLGEDAGYRAGVRERMRRAEDTLFGDVAAVDALSTLLLDARKSPARGC